MRRPDIHGTKARKLTSLAVLLVLGLSATSLEVHTASHPQPASYADLGVEIAEHPPKPAHFGAVLAFVDLRCPVCAVGLQNREAAAGPTRTLPLPARAGALAAGDGPIVPGFLGRLPEPRGPPLA